MSGMESQDYKKLGGGYTRSLPQVCGDVNPNIGIPEVLVGLAPLQKSVIKCYKWLLLNL